MIFSDLKVLRPDGRFPTEMRRMLVQFGSNDNKGYVLLSQGATTIKTTISKIKEKKQLNVNLNFLQACRNEPLNERKVYEIKQKLNSIFALLLPNENQIDINVDILQDNGSLFSTIVNSISLALCYCGINMIGMCVSLTFNNCVDLCHAEENQSFSICVVTIPYKNEILYFESFGKIQKGELSKCLESSKDYCNYIYNYFKEELSAVAKD